MKRLSCLLLALLFTAVFSLSLADTLRIPNGVTEIAAEAFYGNSSLDVVVIPEGVTSIGSLAFAECGISQITLPESLTSIAADAFNYTFGPNDTGIIVNAKSGSTAAAYAAYYINLKQRIFRPGTYTVGNKMPANTYKLIPISGENAKYTYDGSTHNLLGVGEASFENGHILTLSNCCAIVDYEYAVNPEVIPSRTYRALLIGNTYANTAYTLNAPLSDAKAMRSMLKLMTMTPYNITLKSELTSSQILSTIRSTFASATENDVSLLFYSGHGGYGGTLVGIDALTTSSREITPVQLRSVLDQIPGTKIVIVDACYCGGMIGKSKSLMSVSNGKTGSDSSAYVSAFTSAFASSASSSSASPYTANSVSAAQARSVGLLDEAGYYVIASCTGNQVSWEGRVADSETQKTAIAGLFTLGLTDGCGWNYISSSASNDYPADDNRDGLFTLSEVYSYTHNYVNDLVTSEPQTVSCYPSGSDYILFAR